MMTKTTKTTTREYDGDGKLVKEIVTEVTESENVSPCNPFTYPNTVYTGGGAATTTYKTEVTCQNAT